MASTIYTKHYSSGIAAHDVNRAKVQTLVVDPSSDPPIEKSEDLASLSDQLKDSVSFPILPDVYKKSTQDDALIVLVHSVYHLCQIVIHSAVLRRFSSGFVGSRELPSALKRSVEAALANANHIGVLLRQYLENDRDSTRLGPFVGYAAYIATCIFVAFSTVSTRHSSARHVKLQEREVELVAPMIEMIDSLAVFWKPLSKLVRLLLL